MKTINFYISQILCLKSLLKPKKFTQILYNNLPKCMITLEEEPGK